MPETVIIGGGTSGLAAAYTLQNSGVDCLVLEKRDEPGGRIAGKKRDGFIIDAGAQFFFTRYSSTFKLMESLGIKNSLVRFIKPIGILKNGKVHLFDPDIRRMIKSPRSLLDARFLSLPGTLRAAKLGLDLMRHAKNLHFVDAEKALDLDPYSVSDYARRNYGEEVLEYVIQPLVSALTLGEPEEISAAYALALINWGVPGLLTTTDGVGLLAESLSAKVNNIVTGAEAERIVVENNRVRGVVIKKKRKKETIEADKVICCVTASQAAKILGGVDPLIGENLSRITYSSCVHVIFAFSRKIMGDTYAIAVPRKEQLVFCGLTDNSNKLDTYAPQGCSLIHAYTFGKHAKELIGESEEVIKGRVSEDIKSVLPLYTDEQIFCEIVKWEEAVCLSPPGKIAAVARLAREIEKYNGLYIAGEFMGMPSVEAAVASGVKAAENILERG